MSFVPNEKLRSADSLNISVFEIDAVIDSSPVVRDIYTENMAFWKSAIIRNFNIADSMFYRRNPNDELKELKPSGERSLKGWGSYLEVQTAAATPDGELEFVCSSIFDAMLPEFQKKSGLARWSQKPYV